MKPTKVIVLLGSLKTGGAERMGLNIATALLDHNYDVHLVLQNNIVELPHQLPQERVHILNDPPYGSTLRKVKNIVIGYQILTLKLRPDVVLAFTRFSSFLSTFSFCKNIIARFDINPYELTKKGRTLADWVVKWPYVRSIVVPSTGMYDAIVVEGKPHRAKLKHIPNNIDLSQLYTLAEQSHKPLDDKPYICAMGRLAKQKNFPMMLTAYAHSKVRDRYRLIIMGDGPEREYLEKKSRELKLFPDVQFLGMVKNPFPILRNAAYFINTSSRESFCNVILEALSLGVPVVATDCNYGPRDMIIHGENGLLLATEDTQALTFLLDNIAEDKVNREAMAKYAVESVDQFKLQQIQHQWIKLIEQTLN